MNKKVLGTVLALSIIMIVAVVAPALAHNDRDDDKPSATPAPGALLSYACSGDVVLQLPSPSVPSHPYNLRLIASHFDARSANGLEDSISVYVWDINYPGGSRFVWVSQISDVQKSVDFLKAVYAGFVGAANIIKVEDNELEVWKEGDVLMCNLTKAVVIKIGDPWAQHYKDLNFTLPVMRLEFRGFDEVFKEEGALLKFPSGWTGQNTYWRRPAWVRVSIPAWQISNAMTTVGTLNKKVVMTFTPPPAP